MNDAAGSGAPILAPAQRWIETALGTALALVAVAWALGLPQRLDWPLFTEQFLAGILALVLPLAFLATAPRRRRRGAAGVWDVALALVAALAAGYVAVRYPDLQGRLVYRPWDGVAIGVVLVLLVLEAVRRCCGLALLLILLAFVAYALLGHVLPGTLAARPVQWDRLAVYLAMDTNALIGTSLLVAAEVVIPFILMGQILNRGGGADFFNDIALAAAGRSRGGGGKIAVVSSLLFGFVSGSAVANVVSGGIITIPLMMKSGMRADRAAAVEAVSSTGGQLVPPVMGAAAFLMAEFLGVPYRDVALAALAPSLLFYLALYVWCDFAAGRDGLKLVDPARIPRARDVLRSGWHYALPFVALFVALFWWNWSAQLAALFGCAILYVTCTAFGYRGRRMKLRDIGWTIASTGSAVIEVVVICAAAGLVIGVLNLTGLAFGLTLYLGQLAESNVVVLLLVTAAISVVLGMGMPTVAVYVLLAALIAPAMVKAGLDPMAAHMFLLYFGMLSMITPPVALASFAAASIARADFWRTGWEGVKIGWIAYVVPFVFVFQPSVLFRGNLWTGLWEIATACFGVVLGTAAIVGHAKGPVGPAWRAAAGAASVLLFLPVDRLPDAAKLDFALGGVALSGGLVLNLAGAAAGAALLALEARRARR
ncbi:MAG: TRAP transporter fused permease subunit [Candidatus Odyssella sp.]|nr:TRAP transporter fused permease subunit [Candidatus Odyssella sp.]